MGRDQGSLGTVRAPRALPGGRAAAPMSASVRLRAAEHPREAVEPGLLPGDAAIVLVVVQDVPAGGRVPGAPEYVHASVHTIRAPGPQGRPLDVQLSRPVAV